MTSCLYYVRTFNPEYTYGGHVPILVRPQSVCTMYQALVMEEPCINAYLGVTSRLFIGSPFSTYQLIDDCIF
jgi:hypothetical protein